MEVSQTLTSLGFILAVMAIVMAWVYYVFQIKPDDDPAPTQQTGKDKTQQKGQGSSKKKGAKSGSTGNVHYPQAAGSSSSTTVLTSQHPWLVTTLKGHTGAVIGLSLCQNNEFLASIAEDRTVLVWLTRGIEEKDHRNYRLNIPFDYACQIAWSPNYKGFIIAKHDDKLIEAYKFTKRQGDESHATSYGIYPGIKITAYSQHHKTTVVGLGIAGNAKYMMSLSEDGHIIIWDIKGNLLESKLITTTGLTLSGKCSPCGRYVAGCGTFNDPNLDVIEVRFDQNGEYLPLRVRFQLHSHRCGVSAFDFSVDGNKVVTMGMDKKWRLFDTTGNRVNITADGIVNELYLTTTPTITLSHDSRLVLIGNHKDVHMFSGRNGRLLGVISDVHQEPIKSIVFDMDDEYFFTTGDRYIRVFSNIVGIKEKLDDLKIRMEEESVGRALRQRLHSEVEKLKIELKQKEDKLKLNS